MRYLQVPYKRQYSPVCIQHGMKNMLHKVDVITIYFLEQDGINV